jgi:hypothetical protein
LVLLKMERVTSGKSCLLPHQFIIGTPPPGRFLSQNLLVYQVLDIPKGGIGRAFGDFSPLGTVQFAFKPVEQFIDQQALAFVEHRGPVLFPEGSLGQHPRQNLVGSPQSAGQAIQKPQQPFRYIQVAFLGVFQDFIILVPFQPDSKTPLLFPWISTHPGFHHAHPGLLPLCPNWPPLFLGEFFGRPGFWGQTI